MKVFLNNDPIIACSTGDDQNTALAVLRLSGFRDITTLSPFFNIQLENLKPYQVRLCDLISRGEVYDQILLTYFKGPKSYTGENVLELSVHGNQLNVQRIIKLFTENAGFRLAQAGEFTYRALKNKKLSLSQVEGLDVLLNASSPFLLNEGLKALHGELEQQYLKLRQNFIKLRASVELSIDFLDDVGEESASQQICETFAAFSNTAKALYDRSQVPLNGLFQPKVVLLGLPNSGKSSLFNKLLNQDRSIVSSQAGTTRDYVSEFISINQTPFKLIDTAGLREQTLDHIEQLGMKRTQDLAESAFFNVLVINPLDYVALKDFLKEKRGFDFIVFTHSDSVGFSENFSLCRSILHESDEYICVNTSDARGHDSQLELIRQAIWSKYKMLTDSNPIVLERHRRVIGDIHERCSELSELLVDESDIAIISSHVNILGSLIEELIGVVTPDQVLRDIFSNFCIGK